VFEQILEHAEDGLVHKSDSSSLCPFPHSQASKIIKDVPLLDSLVYTPKKIRAKAKAKA
jgi:hypothetical protein